MINISNCTILKVKSFWGLTSVDPAVPIDEFIKENLNNIKLLIDQNLIIVIDENDIEVDKLQWVEYIKSFKDEKPLLLESDNKIEKNANHEALVNLKPEPLTQVDSTYNKSTYINEWDNHSSLDDIKEDEFEEEFEIEKLLDDLVNFEQYSKIQAEEKKQIENKSRLIKSLEDCESEYKELIEESLERINYKIDQLKDERKLISSRINSE